MTCPPCDGTSTVPSVPGFHKYKALCLLDGLQACIIFGWIDPDVDAGPFIIILPPLQEAV